AALVLVICAVFAPFFLFFALHRRCIRRRSLGPLLGLQRCVGQALATEAIAECIRSGGVGEAESNIEWLDLVSTPAAADRDASFTIERINLFEKTGKTSRRKCEVDQIREVPFVRKAGDLALATSHLAQSSSASRFTACVSITEAIALCLCVSIFLIARLTRSEA